MQQRPEQKFDSDELWNSLKNITTILEKVDDKDQARQFIAKAQDKDETSASNIIGNIIEKHKRNEDDSDVEEDAVEINFEDIKKKMTKKMTMIIWRHIMTWFLILIQIQRMITLKVAKSV
eukprot:1198096-Ditylum_brightwellii.AAC.1